MLRRLILYFVTSFIIFALIIGVVFSVLFSRHNMEVHKTELGRRAVSIAGTLSGFMEDSGNRRGNSHGMGMGMMGHGMMTGGYGAYLQFIEDIAMGDVWVVDRDLDQIIFGHGHMNLAVKDLPEGADKTVAEAYDGATAFSESFGEVLDAPAVTAAAPIILNGGEVGGVVLLHSQVADVRAVTAGGITLLAASMGAAVLISAAVAAALSSHYTKPLAKMKAAAIKISGGDYSASTGVRQPDEIGELAVIMDGMAVKLDAASKESAALEKLRRDFIANISHELRTPVTVIRGSLEALTDGVVTDGEKVSEYHKQMFSESIYLERLVTDLLELARLQNPDFAFKMEPVDLKSAAADAVRSMERIAVGKNVTLDFKYESGDHTVTGDYGRLRQMLIIILDNAVKFSGVGKTVSVSLFKTDAVGIALHVRDEGCGIRPEELPYIFDRFYKQGSEQNKSGTGLGMAIAKQIAERHGGTIGAESVYGEGTEISVKF